MPAFTTESAVRLRMQLTDTTLAPADLIQQCINDAHAQLLARLAPEVDQNDPPELLAQGEGLLAGALVLQALAAKDAVAQKQVSIGGQRVESGERFSALRKAAEEFTAEAWHLLGPFLSPASPAELLHPTDSQPLFQSL